VPPDEEEKGNNIEEQVKFASSSDLTHEAEFQQELKYNKNREEVYTNSNELSEVLKLLATKIGQSDSSRTVVPIESFSTVVLDFDGVSIPIRQWLKCFNESASAYELTLKQKYVNARMKMKGSAMFFLESTTVSDYDTLCEVLLDEFDKTLTSAEVHKQLRERKKNDNEDFHEYVLHMRKIAALGIVEDESVIRYIADGLKLRDDLKYPLFSATTFKELRSRSRRRYCYGADTR